MRRMGGHSDAPADRSYGTRMPSSSAVWVEPAGNFPLQFIVAIRPSTLLHLSTLAPSRVGFYPDNFLEGQWDVDILSPEGLKKMQEIVAYIKAEADEGGLLE